MNTVVSPFDYELSVLRTINGEREEELVPASRSAGLGSGFWDGGGEWGLGEGMGSHRSSPNWLLGRKRQPMRGVALAMPDGPAAKPKSARARAGKERRRTRPKMPKWNGGCWAESKEREEGRGKRMK
jgi:hypothetical protein